MAEDTAEITAGDAALEQALAAEHAAIWGYGVVGAALGPGDQELVAAVTAAEVAHRDVRDRVTTVLTDRGAEPVAPEGGYALPFPVLSAVDAAELAAVLEDGVSAAWVRALDRATERAVRQLAVEVLGAAEVRAVGWRAAAGQDPSTRAFPGL